ncbi:MAG: anhydro-N-acetylmuramic acid kinase [Ekhidna sp.]
MMHNTTYRVLGAMAGSSMDGLDVAIVHFQFGGNAWSFKLERAETIAYPDTLFSRLAAAPGASLPAQKQLDEDFGAWIGSTLREFVADEPIALAAVHGHTIVHAPGDGISWQLGKGEVIANQLPLPVISDFRTKDIQLGGEGAPLVPYGDFQLFHAYDACLNLGGIANVSLRKQQIAWDICPCNQVLNSFSGKLGMAFDHNGTIASTGNLDEAFIRQIRELSYFHQPPPKSLPNHFIPSKLLNLHPKNGLRSFTEFIALQIANDLQPYQAKNQKLLVTGGGAFNRYLIERIRHHLKSWEVILPEPDIINFKEAIIFAFLGLLRFRNEVNVLKSVTGATSDSSSGVIHLPK